METKWISVEEALPEQDYCHVLVTRHYWNLPESKSVQYSFYIKDREQAKKSHTHYSRKYQGKHSVHFDQQLGGMKITHWMYLPEPA